MYTDPITDVFIITMSLCWGACITLIERAYGVVAGLLAIMLPTLALYAYYLREIKHD